MRAVVGAGVLVGVGSGVLVGVGVGVAEPSQLLFSAVLASPGVMQRWLRSTLFWWVSTPSGKREMPSWTVELSSNPRPDPSVYGAAVSPS